MVERFNLDTSIWLDLYEKRGINGERAMKLITKIVLENEIIIYSDILIKELKHLGYFPNEINEMLLVAKPDNIEQVQINKKQIKEAERISSQRNVPKRDVLHAILSRDNEAHMITRDYHFQKLKDIIVSELPEDFT